ncbi:MAG TPA: pilus assembly protein TadG-related protein, partial [Thermoleophilaceae bacterium]
MTRASGERGQTSILLLGVLATLIAISLMLAAFGQALGGRGRVQRIADLAAISGAHAMRESYPRLFEPPQLAPNVPNPRHLSRAQYLALARAAALRAARRNGQALLPADIQFPDAASMAPTRIAVSVRAQTDVRISQDRRGGRRRIPVKAHAEAELSPPADDGLGPRGHGEYTGPLAYRQGKPMRPDVAQAFDRMQRAAASAGVRLLVVSA